MSGKTLYDKIWDAHVAHEADDGTCLLYIDRHLVHEVTSPQAFEGLRMAGRKVRAPDKTIAVPDHNVPTTEGRNDPAQMPEDSRIQVAALDQNAKDFGIQNDQLVLIESRHGHMQARALITSKQKKGSIFAPMHWNDMYSLSGKVGNLVNAVTDPVSGHRSRYPR